MKKAISSFSRMSDGNLESKTHSIISNMTGNANFPTPTPSLAALETAADNYSSALVKALTGNRADVADKNAKRAELENVLRSLCTYVNLTANGDAAMILSSGFDISKDPQPVVLTRPENLRVDNGAAPGTLLVSVKAVKGAHAYFHEYTTDATMAPGSWVSTTGTTSRMQFTNLQPGTVYYCRVGAIGTNNQLLYSDAVSRMVI
ncbi:hypothetical protein IQ13_3249 [Lacibacter cauensis]|uniref:Fibronectin type-III domain-containing protein n=1 Tax=Lacibacter cauensis TaxID=510947 RepID=A0A562SIK8_9BACT|nr:fibronectin type III domain-containing protein [Lacibacter cauensis]TWI80570.1 hypothetical protein IQ13_3249 [Lacibacter cauensis]